MMSRAHEPSEVAADPVAGAGPPAEEEGEHAAAMRRLADTMLRTALWPGIATVGIATVIAGFVAGLSGVFGALVGGSVAAASSLATIGLIKWSRGMHPMAMMAVALGGYAGKILVLMIVMTLLTWVEGLHPMSLALTMLATVLVSTAAEAQGFRKTKIPTIVPAAGS